MRLSEPSDKGESIPRSIVQVALAVCALLLSPAIRAAEESSSARDVSPQPGLVFASTSEAFLFRGRNQLLVSSGRAGAHRTSDRGNHWRRSMRGAVDQATGIEPMRR